MSKNAFDRREFGRRIALGAALAIAADDAVAEQPPVKEPPNPKPAEGEPPPDFRPPQPADILTDLIFLKYGDERLTPEIMGQIHREVQGDLYRSRSLTKFPLTNADEPAPVFTAFRADG